MKKILMMVLSLVLVAALSIGGTVAYLQDTDEDVNVMTLGNVKIEQIELQRVQNDDGTYPTETIGGRSSYKLEAFEQGKMLVPTTEIDANGNPVNFGAGGYQDTVVMFEQLGSYNGMQVFESENAVDKFVFVKNTGNTPAYVRTLIAFEMGSLSLDESKLMTRKSYHGGWDLKEAIEVTIDGKDYAVYEYVYKGYGSTHTDGVLPAGATTPCSLAQVYLNSAATNETVEKLDGNKNGTYDILVVSQAVQADGFADAATALKAGFGEANATNVAAWFGGEEFEVPAVVNASTTDELADAVENETNAFINLNEGTYETNITVDGGKDLTIVGNGTGTVLNGQIATTASDEGTLVLRNLTINVSSAINDSTGISQTSKSAIAIWGDQTVICENVTFNMDLADSTAITSWWDTGVGTTIICKNCTFNCNGQRPIRATGNVTVENCTFNDPYRYAVQLTAKASTATLLDKAIINFNNNTIVNGEHGKSFVYGIQLEGADYGCNNCVINGTGNTINAGTWDAANESAMYYCECGKVDHDTITWNTEVAAKHENP